MVNNYNAFVSRLIKIDNRSKGNCFFSVLVNKTFWETLLNDSLELGVSYLPLEWNDRKIVLAASVDGHINHHEVFVWIQN